LKALIGILRCFVLLFLLANLGSIRWQGKVERDQELLLIIKTKSELVSTVANEIKSKHPYDVPEVISLPIQGGLQGNRSS